MDIQIPTTDADFDINPLILQKMAFVFNALEDGWAIKKKKIYIFLVNTMRAKKKFI